MGEELQDDEALPLLIMVAATAGPLRTDILAVIHLMPMGMHDYVQLSCC